MLEVRSFQLSLITVLGLGEMHKRFTNSFTEKDKGLIEDIAGIEVKVTRLFDEQNVDRYSKEFLVMSTGIIYVRPIFYTDNKDEKWKYLHDDSLVATLAGDRVYLINNFRNACLDSTNRHLIIYNHFFKNAEKNYKIIKKAIKNYSDEMNHHYSKIGAQRLYGNEVFSPWI